jgi:type IV pilus assembly protein PilB
MAVLTEEVQAKVVTALVDEGILIPGKLGEYRTKAKTAHQPLFAYLVSQNTINEEQLTEAIAKVSGVPYVNLGKAVIDGKVLALLQRETAERFMAAPLGETNDGGAKRLAVAMLDPTNLQAVDFLSNAVGRPIKVYIASETGINNVLDQYHVDLNKSVDATLAAAEDNAAVKPGAGNEVKVIVQDSPISKILTQLLEYAQRARASDIHIEPLEDKVAIRCRIDGVLRIVMELPKSIEAALISRIKILSNLKIDEHRKPQDGQFTVMVGDKEVDLRIAISPVVWGVEVVIRLLDK